jgi:hypothetical protein
MFGCMAANVHMDLSPYLHDVLPAVLTCLLSKDLARPSGGKGTDGEGHWIVRDHAASVLAKLCSAYTSLAPRVKRQLVSVLADSSHSLPTLYGTIKYQIASSEHIAYRVRMVG